jgi:hypothetical protein
MPNAPSQLTVTRPGPGTWSDNYGMSVSLDGEVIARLAAGRSVTREIPPGPHRLRVNNTLMWKTIEFDAEPGARIHYVASNRPGWLTTILAMVGTSWFYLDVDRVDDKGSDEPMSRPSEG